MLQGHHRRQTKLCQTLDPSKPILSPTPRSLGNASFPPLPRSPTGLKDFAQLPVLHLKPPSCILTIFSTHSNPCSLVPPPLTYSKSLLLLLLGNMFCSYSLSPHPRLSGLPRQDAAILQAHTFLGHPTTTQSAGEDNLQVSTLISPTHPSLFLHKEPFSRPRSLVLIDL